LNVPEAGRTAQRARTRKTIVRAAADLLVQGARPGLDEVANAAGVSRATAYRYFPGLDALLNEAAVDMLVPEPQAMFDRAGAPAAAADRLEQVDRAFDIAIRAREVPLRLMLARILERSVHPGADDAPLRQNRRVPLIESALAPHRDRMVPAVHGLLVNALAMIIGTEGYITLNDVIGLDQEAAREVRLWAIDALLRAALEEGQPSARV
jgi:AcrR family transcriptional regulator